MKLSLALALLLMTTACSSSEDAPKEPTATADPVESSVPETDATRATTRSAVAGTLRLDVPSTWTEEVPSNTMRVGQFAIGDDGTTLVVFFFGVGGGGGVEDNMARWIGQVTQADGSSSADVAERATETRGGVTLHHLDVTGNFSGGRSGGGGSNWRFLGAVVECDGGPFFFKLTGPASSVGAIKPDYEAVLASIRPGG